MGFLAQIPLKRPLKLSVAYDAALVFMCAEERSVRGTLERCSTFHPGYGASAVILQKGDARAPGCRECNRFPQFGFTLARHDEPEIDTSDCSLPEALLSQVWGKTKLGGVPGWLQSNEWLPCPVCGGETDFVVQLDSEIEKPATDPSLWDSAWEIILGDEVSAHVDAGKAVLLYFNGDGHRIEAVEPTHEFKPGVSIIADPEELERAEARVVHRLPFGASGVSYVFKCRKECSDLSASLLWQTS
ncbi:MAG: hypothetical protein FJ291_10355 [Planctomycetes bacterium]|nr:hypothetical protein [Planctomycetota bacterium]